MGIRSGDIPLMNIVEMNDTYDFIFEIRTYSRIYVVSNEEHDKQPSRLRSRGKIGLIVVVREDRGLRVF